MFFVYCVPSFHCRNLAAPQLSMLNCLNTVVNWLLQWNNFVTLDVCCVLIRAINPPFKKNLLFVNSGVLVNSVVVVVVVVVAAFDMCILKSGPCRVINE